MSGLVASNGGGVVAVRASSGGIINTSNIGSAGAGGVATGKGAINSSMIVADNSNT